jgi:hypothetical protein
MHPGERPRIALIANAPYSTSSFRCTTNRQVMRMIITDDHSLLGHQAQGRELTAKERELANAMLKAFGSGEHDFAAIARLLEQWKVPRPSGDPGPWSVENLEQELHQINNSLDQAYASNGFGA